MSVTTVSSPKPGPGRAAVRVALSVVAGVFLVVLLCLGGIAWYAHTAAFQSRVRLRLIAGIEQATGGRVELEGLQWHFSRLEVEVNNLTIHGLEGPAEIPYAHVDHLLIRARILSLLSPAIGLSLLQADHPVLHLIVNKDGTTNQPTPKTPMTNKPVGEALLDLEVERADFSQGLALINERSIPFDLAGDNFGVQLRYLPRSEVKAAGGATNTDHYSVTATVADLTLHRQKEVPVHSRLDLALDLYRNNIDLQSLRLHTVAAAMEASGTITNFAAPEWKGKADGTLDLRQVKALTGVEGLDRGLAELHLHGGGDASGRFAIDGKGRIDGATYTGYNLNVTGVSGTAALHATESDLRMENVSGSLKQGGSLEGSLRLANWLGSALPSVPAQRSRAGAWPVGAIRARVTNVTLETVLTATAPRQFRDIGFDTASAGNVAVDWTGSGADLTLDAKLSIAPPAHLDAGEVPVTGTLDARYLNRSGTVEITSLTAKTPATEVQVSGALGVYPVDRPSLLQGTLKTSNLGEFNRTLTDLGFAANGKTGVEAIPFQLHGNAELQGTVTGTVLAPDVKGHLTATNFGLMLPLQKLVLGAEGPAPLTPSGPSLPQQKLLNWDRLDADAEYNSQFISVQKATILHGKTTIQLAGQLHARQTGRTKWEFDEQSPINATLDIHKGAVEELLALAGESTIPATGIVDLNAHLGGSLNHMNGGGHLNVTSGQIYGEPYKSLSSDIVLAGHQVSLSELSLLQDGGRLTGEGSYDLKSAIFHGAAQGRGFELSHIRQLQTHGMAISGSLEFDASGQGTIENPVLEAKAHLRGLVIGDQAMGDLQGDAHTEQHTLRYTVDSSLKQAKMHLAGQTELAAPNQTRAQVVFSEFDIDPLLQLARMRRVSEHSLLAGTVRVSGPLAQPRQLSGEAELSQITVSVAGLPLKTEGQVHATLRAGALHFDPLHVIGEETDLKARGSLNVFGLHALDMHAEGTVNVGLAKSINPDLTSSGRVEFGVDATGTVERPSLLGQVKFTDVAMSLQDLPNGLSQMNGTLRFNQDRLEVENLTASTGGGQLKLGGYVTYQQGLYGDLTATGKTIRIRYPQGVSSVANASLHLQGQPANMLLSGDIVVTRFAISPDLDIAGLAGSANAVSVPPPDNSPSNHVRLDINITSAPQLNFQNSLAKLAGDVDLHIRGTVASPSVLGRVNITEGSATFAGTQYQLQRGDIYFTNPVRIEPNIDVDATARVEEYDINIGVHGTPQNLNVSYRSEPPLPQADVIALLALGRTQDEQRINSQQQAAAGVNPATDALLSGALNATLSNRVQKLFGVGTVKIDPTFVGTLGTSTARITVEQQVAKDVLLTYATNVNTTAQQLIQAQVNLTRNVSVVAIRDESGVFSMVLKVHKRIR